jgi:hypothetical protein
MTALYLIYARNSDGESLDLIVEARSLEEAERIWRDWVENEMENEVDEKDFAIYSVPSLTGKPHALEWGVNSICLKDTRR